jgi:hypothetical protein
MCSVVFHCRADIPAVEAIGGTKIHGDLVFRALLPLSLAAQVVSYCSRTGRAVVHVPTISA